MTEEWLNVQKMRQIIYYVALFLLVCEGARGIVFQASLHLLVDFCVCFHNRASTQRIRLFMLHFVKTTSGPACSQLATVYCGRSISGNNSK
uniref:Secreted protein n=1 Tax=Heterorhabditis bacteriophora TaxID=37862 RepID=A0A1I7XBC0_HETBA